jgi:hypothetical protein
MYYFKIFLKCCVFYTHSDSEHETNCLFLFAILYCLDLHLLSSAHKYVLVKLHCLHYNLRILLASYALKSTPHFGFDLIQLVSGHRSESLLYDVRYALLRVEDVPASHVAQSADGTLDFLFEEVALVHYYYRLLVLFPPALDGVVTDQMVCASQTLCVRQVFDNVRVD